jgi:spoIIIJ-associated protein
MDTQDIKKIIEGLLQTLPVKIEVIDTIVADGKSPIFTIRTPDSGVLIGTRGAHFQALSFLLKRIVASQAEKKGVDEPKFFIDVNNYRASMVQGLATKAMVLAERARSMKTEVEMEPMNAYERLIVHEILAGMTNIKTESRGEGPGRRIVISYSEKEKEDPLAGI